MDLGRADPVSSDNNQLAADSEVYSNLSLSSLTHASAVTPECQHNSGLPSKYRPLPPGKLYHVFFSHCNEDLEWVREMVDRLESPEYGLTCCYADRDFDLGVPVIQNITKCIHTSKRTVIVMSSEFLQSAWCSYETRITLELDLDTRQRLLIPVMLRSCRVPDYIGRLTYIDVQNDHFWGRFVAAIEEDDSTTSIVPTYMGSSAMITGVPFNFNPNFNNTDEIVEVTVYQGCNFCAASPSDFVPNELMRNGLHVTPSEYRDIVTAVTSTFYVRCHGCFNKNLHATPTACAVCVTWLLFIISAKYFLQHVFLIIVLLLLLSALSVVLYKVCVLKAMRRISHATEDANRIAQTSNLVVIVKDSAWCVSCTCTCEKMSIIFYYYDWKPCHSYLTQFLTEFRRPDNENEAWDLLVKHATEYCQLLLNRRLKTPNEQRHTRQGECLCQFVESILVSGKSSCCDYVFGVRSRHPWRRYCFF